MGEELSNYNASFLILVLIFVLILLIYVKKFKPFVDLQKNLKYPDHCELYKKVFQTPRNGKNGNSKVSRGVAVDNCVKFYRFLY